MTKTRQGSPNMISRIFTNQFQQICIISISTDTYLNCIFKSCQIVESKSMTRQFPEF